MARHSSTRPSPWTSRTGSGPSTRRRRSDATKGRRRTSRRRRLVVIPLTLVAVVVGTMVAWSTAGRLTVTELTVVDEAGNVYTLEGSAELVLVPSEDSSPSPSPTTATSTSTEEATSEPAPTASPSTSRTAVDDGASGDVRQLSGDVRAAEGLTVPEGETYRFDPDRSTTLTVSENIIVRGRLEMKPASPDVVHTIRFTGVDESAFVGGGMEVLDSDVGLWVVGNGQLDIQGTPRAGWNRTGSDPSWRAGDEVYVTPTDPRDYGPRPFTPGDPVPTATAPDGTVHRAEVFNVTRNVMIEGTSGGRAHITILGGGPQTVRHAAIRHMGPRQPNRNGKLDGVMGRYPLHFHHNGDASRGSVVEGVVVRDSGNRAFVPHASHGITMTDLISLDTHGDPYWWDVGDATHDLLWEHVLAVRARPQEAGRHRNAAFVLGSGTNVTIRDAAAVAVSGGKDPSGFMWPEGAGSPATWVSEDLVAHNNRAHGIFVWQNDREPHVVDRFVAYHNRRMGVAHGAYTNDYVYRDLVLFGNGDAIRHGAVGANEQRWVGLDTDGDIRIGHHNRPTDGLTVYEDLTLRGSRVVVDESGEPATFLFRSSSRATDLARGDFDVVSCLSAITVENSDGSRFRVC